MYTNYLHNFSKHAIVSLTDAKGRDFNDEAKRYSFRIEEKLLERFEVALHYEGLKKTDVLTHAIQQFCTKVECEKMNDVKRQYNVSNHLQTRINTHKHYEEKHVNLDEVVMDHLQLQGDEKY